MRRFCVVLAAVLVILAAFSQLVLPGLMENRLGNTIRSALQAEYVCPAGTEAFGRPCRQH